MESARSATRPIIQTPDGCSAAAQHENVFNDSVIYTMKLYRDDRRDQVPPRVKYTFGLSLILQ